MHVTNGDGRFPEEYGAGQPPEQEGGQAATGPGKPSKAPGALWHLMTVGLRGQRGASAQAAKTPRPETESRSDAGVPAAEPAPATALSAAGHPLPNTFDSLYRLAGMNSSSSYGEVTITVNGKTLVDWQQLPKLLTENCHVSIDLGHRDGGPDLTLLRVLIELNLALQRETRAAVTLAVPNRFYERTIKRLSLEEYGAGGNGLRFEAPWRSNLSGFFRQPKRA